MNQQAPFPEALPSLVKRLTYRPGWRFTLLTMDRGQDCAGLTLLIQANVINTHDGLPITINHLMPVPPAAFNERSWRRWLLEQVLLVEQHEACEFFKIDGKQPYCPNHGPGNDPYTIREFMTDEDAETGFDGIRRPREAAL